MCSTAPLSKAQLAVTPSEFRNVFSSDKNILSVRTIIGEAISTIKFNRFRHNSRVLQTDMRTERQNYSAIYNCINNNALGLRKRDAIGYSRPQLPPSSLLGSETDVV